MNYWLVKSEPDTYAWSDFVRDGRTAWTGVRNYQARIHLNAMRTAGRGSLVGIASVSGYRGLPGGGAYSASKAAAIAYLESLRVEMHGSGVSVITICPGYITTPMTTNNPFRMPFILSAEAMAERIVRIVERKKLYAVIPWQMAIVARVLRLLPNFLYDSLFANAPRKPR